MDIRPLEIPDILLINPQVYGDNRGFFFESHNTKVFSEIGIETPFVQDNHSGSKMNTLRGLHYQIHQEQGKLVRVIVGEVYDVAVDLRKKSSTFGKWVGTKLSAENHEQIWIPAGFAHGFLVLSEWAEILYKVTDYYAPEWEHTLLWNDPEIGVEWPLGEGKSPILSQKDSDGIPLRDAILFE